MCIGNCVGCEFEERDRYGLLLPCYWGSKDITDVPSFWARDLSVTQCVEETGLDAETVQSIYDSEYKQFCKDMLITVEQQHDDTDYYCKCFEYCDCCEYFKDCDYTPFNAE